MFQIHRSFSFVVDYDNCLFSKAVDKSAGGAAKVNDADTLDQCLQNCIDDSSQCAAVEFSTKYGCYKHTTMSFVDDLGDNMGVTMYKLVSCGMLESLLL